MKNQLVRAAGCIILVMLTSCSKIAVLELFNNTDSDLEVTSADTAGQEKHYRIPSKSFGRIQIPTVLTIKHANERWIYDFREHPIRFDRNAPYVKFERSGGSLEQFQIENSGFIYILLANAEAPAKNFPTQPEGYPLKPGTANQVK